MNKKEEALAIKEAERIIDISNKACDDMLGNFAKAMISINNTATKKAAKKA